MSTKKSLLLPSGTTVAYWEYGTGDRSPIIMVHGFTGSHDGFQYIAPLLTDYRVIVPDLPGFGESPITAESWTIGGLGILLAQFIQALKLTEKPYLIAHSMGTLITAAALRHDTSIAQRQLVLISPIPTKVRKFELRTPGKLLGQLQYTASRLPKIGGLIARSKLVSRATTALIVTTNDPKLREAIYKHHFANLDFISSIPLYDALYNEMNRSGVIEYADYLAAFDILIINGDRDRATPLGEQRILAAALAARLQVIPDVGHLAHYETPRAIAELISGFLQ